MTKTPRVAAIHDMSGFGRCSLTVAIPVLSAMGVQCCPLPTAFLSTHTGGFQGFTFLDMTEEMPRVAEHWKSLGLTFSAIYSGFLGSERQIGIVADFIRDFRTPDTVVVVDPVMGDDGQAYQTYTPAMCGGMARLAELADVITPNLTEAAFLLGLDYRELPTDGDGLRRVAMAITAKTNAPCCTLGPGGQGLAYALAAAPGGDVRGTCKALNAAYQGRGGGKPGFCQGSLAEGSFERVKAFLLKSLLPREKVAEAPTEAG